MVNIKGSPPTLAGPLTWPPTTPVTGSQNVTPPSISTQQPTQQSKVPNLLNTDLCKVSMNMSGGGNLKKGIPPTATRFYGLTLKTTRAKAGMRDFCFYNGVPLY